MNNNKIYSQSDLISSASSFWGDCDLEIDIDLISTGFFDDTDSLNKEEEEDEMKCIFFN